MMKKALVLSLVLVSLILTRPSVSQAVLVTQEEPNPLKLTLNEVPDVQYSVTNIPIKVTFENVGKNPLRLFNAFDKAELPPLFFSLKIERSDGHTFFYGGGQAKVDFAYNSIKYITLAPGEKYSFTVNLKDWLGDEQAIPNGTYKITMAYQNQYGKDCFKVKPWLQTDRPLYLRLWLTDK